MVPTPAGGQDLLQPELREPSATGVEARLRVADGLLVMCALIRGRRLDPRLAVHRQGGGRLRRPRGGGQRARRLA
ncbi:MAG: hypothetical protein ACK5F5_05410 [Gammaproteobacteria bacterium]|jgi:hypothetical protein